MQAGKLPDWLGNLTSLTSLDVSSNELTSLPESLGNLTALTSLDLGYGRLGTLPDWLGNLTSLTSLDVSSNELTSLPESLGNLTALTSLDLSSNQLASLPDWLENLTSLTSLNLSSNEMAGIPDWLANLSALTNLNLSLTRVVTVPESIGNLTTLTRLNLAYVRLGTLPDWLGNLTALTTLSLRGNQLTSMPEYLGNLTALTDLDLGINQLTSVPEYLGNLTALTDLDLSGNELTSVPDCLGNLTALTNLDLSGNELTSVPDCLGNLTALIDLALGGNQLTEVPEWMGNLTALIRLNLADNELVSLPQSLGKLRALNTLNLSTNKLTDLPMSLGNLTLLTYLNLGNHHSPDLPSWIVTQFPISARRNIFTLVKPAIDGNKFISLPQALRRLTGLQELDLGNVSVSTISEWLSDLVNLTHLDLQGNELTVVPDSLGNLTALTSLDLQGNQLTVVPDSLGNLTALTSLDLQGNQLTVVPDSLGNLTALTSLDLQGNQLTVVPDSLGNLTALTSLDLQGNQLTVVPDSLGNLTALTSLDLQGNQLTVVPDSLGNLTALTHIGLSANPLRSPLLEIAEDGTLAVKAYLSLLTQNAAELWVSKLLVVGEGAVGKTSLVKSLVGDTYDIHEPTTHGIRITEVTLCHPVREGIRMRLSSWDFGGQDIYHATHQFFLSDRSLFVLLWNSRQGWEQAKLPYWLDIIQARAPHSRVILVATHAEGRPLDLPLTDLKNSYPQIVGIASVDNSSQEGIDALRTMMAEEAIKLPLMGSRWPSTWISGVEAIRTCEMQHTTPELLYKRLSVAGVTDRSHQTYLLRALHVLGDILYFDEDEDLRDTVILRPQWVNEYIAKVLDSPEVAAQEGLLTRSHERDLWHDLNPGLRDRFLQMMEKFDLSYRTTDDDTAASLVVERLPWDSSPYHEAWDRALGTAGAREIRLRYQLNTLPPGVPTWFIAREHRFTTGTHWRSGALLCYRSDPRVYGLIKAERKDNTVELAARGPVPQLFFSVLQDGFESTLGRYPGLEINRLVPCTCMNGNGTQAGKQCLHLYQYGPLLRRLEKGVSEVECELSFTKVNVSELLFGIAPTTTDQLVSWMGSIDHQLSSFRAEAAWAQREFLKTLRRNQISSEALCPSVFTLTPVPGGGRRPGFRQLELNLYCEQPGAFHVLPEEPYVIDQPTRWLVAISPYLSTLVAVLKHTAPLAGPVLGITADHLAKRLADQVNIMTEVISQLPNNFGAESELGPVPKNDSQGRIKFDADYRAIYALLHQLDPNERWAGLNRVISPEGQIIWLCADHAEQQMS